MKCLLPASFDLGVLSLVVLGPVAVVVEGQLAAVVVEVGAVVVDVESAVLPVTQIPRSDHSSLQFHYCYRKVPLSILSLQIIPEFS